MTALLLTLFGGAGLLAVGCLCLTIRRHAAAALAIGRELEAATYSRYSPPPKARIYRRSKAQLTSRAAKPHGPIAREPRRNRRIADQHDISARINDRRRRFGESLMLQPGTLVFE